MLTKMRVTFRDPCQLEPDKRIVVGVSGGADSLCLLDLLALAGYPLLVVYFNHNLRPEAANEATTVEHLAKNRHALFISGAGDVRGTADRRAISIEMAARVLRYQFLFNQAEEHHAQAVAVAHHADDQVETVLMHVLRGSGVNGLSGMRMRQLPNPWSASIPLVRPLLDTWRNEILAYCQAQGLQPLEDRTNFDVTYTRNRIRHELIPQLESYNPRIKETLLRMSQVVQGESQIVDQLAAKAWRDCLVHEVEAGFAFDPSKVDRLPTALQRQLLRRAVSFLRGGLRDIDYALVERGISAIQQPPHTRQVDLGLGLGLLWEQDLLWLASWEADIPVGDCPQLRPQDASGVALPAPGSLDLAAGWRLVVRDVSPELAWRSAPGNPNPYQAWIDAGEINSPLSVRSRHPGDRFQPLGSPGCTQKISDLMINRRLPKRRRGLWPLVCGGAEIIWVPGYALSHKARLQSTSRSILYLELKRVNGS